MDVTSHDRPKDRREFPSIFETHPISTGIGLGLVLLAPHALLPREASVGFAALLIALIAGIYFGFAVVRGSFRDQLVELAVASVYAIVGLLGLVLWPVLLPLAYFAHGLWDFAHHRRAHLPLVAIPAWYVPWCAIIDGIIGTGLLVLWGRSGWL